MTLSVRPNALDSYAAQLRRARDDAGITKSYLTRSQISGDWDDGAYIKALGDSHVKAMDAALSTTESLVHSLNRNQDGMAAAADYYRRADEESADAMDATLPTAKPGRPTVVERDWRDDPCGPSFSDTRDPVKTLKEVDEPEYDHPFSFLDHLSLSNWALKAVEAAIGVNPLEEAAARVAGDWQAFGRSMIILEWNAALEVMNNFYGAVQACIGLVEVAAGQLSDARFSDVASTAYNHPIASRQSGGGR